MVRLRYVAYIARDADELSRFYADHLGLVELGRSAAGDVSLTDGFFNLTFLQLRDDLGEPRLEPGLHHLGLEVDSISAICEQHAEQMPHWQSAEEPGGVHHGEFRLYDPDATPVSLSERGFGVPGKDRGIPRLAHVALNSVNTEAMLEFYTGLFGFRTLKTTEERRRQGRLNRFMGDGDTNLAVHPYHNDQPGHEARFGVNHVGFLVSDMEDKVQAFSKVIEVAKRPDNRPYAEYRLHDPEGNGFDLSRNKGWEVDDGKWENAA